MKSIYIFIALLVIIFGSCKKKGCTDSTATNYDSSAKKDDGSCTYPTDPEPPISVNSQIQYDFFLDGENIKGKISNSVDAANSKHTSSGIPYGYVHGTSFYNKDTYATIISFDKGVMASQTPTDNEFRTFLSAGNQVFAGTDESGMAIETMDENMTIYSSKYGPQTGSSCTIVETKDEYFGPELYIKTYITFHCKVYNENDVTDFKTITNGKFVSHFAKL